MLKPKFKYIFREIPWRIIKSTLDYKPYSGKRSP